MEARKQEKKQHIKSGTLVLITLFLVSILLLLFPMFGSAAVRNGCCCLSNGTAQSGSLLEETKCDTARNFTFVQPTNITPPVKLSEICLQACKTATVVPELINVSFVCGNPDFKPPVFELTSTPIKGKREIELTWKSNCTSFVNSFSVARCSGNVCTERDLSTSRVISGNENGFIDADPNLEYNHNYTYQIITQYKGIGNSVPTLTTVYSGDLECDGKTTSDPFCLSLGFYTTQEQEFYLKQFGYLPPATADKFRKAFKDQVAITFFSKTNTAYTCTDRNLLVQRLRCSSETTCIVRQNTPQCTQRDPCSNVSPQHFGLNISIEACEGATTNPRYCFYDKSARLIDFCFPCRSDLACLDYKSKDTCTRDNCGIKNCQWKDVFVAIGIGVCINTEQNNCFLCEVNGTAFAPNLDVNNKIFDTCTKERSEALSTPKFPCFFSNQDQKSRSCKDVSCPDYTKEECAAPNVGIQKNNLNQITIRSSDPCNIGVCDFNDQHRCAKNANAIDDAPGDFRDCSGFSSGITRACELDYFPPETIIISISNFNPSRVDALNITRLDRFNATTTQAVVPGKLNPTTYCVFAEGKEPCTPSLTTTSDNLLLNDLGLNDGQEFKAQLSEGTNNIRFFSEDPNHNLEVIKTFSFTACKSCQGPVVLQDAKNVSKSIKIGNIFHTSDPNPQINIAFNENTQVSVSQFIQSTPSRIIGAQQNLIVPNTNFTYSPIQTLNEGSYTFKVFGSDTQGTPMDTSDLTSIIVDLTPPRINAFANLIPLEGALLNKSVNTILLNFTEPVIIENITNLHQVVDLFNSRIEETSLTTNFTSANQNRIYTALLKLIDGPNSFVIKGSDLAANRFTFNINFIVSANPSPIRLVLPPFGASPNFTFDVLADTLFQSTCRYLFNPGVFVPTDFTSWQEFDTTSGVHHTKFNFNEIISGPQNRNKRFPLLIRCKDNQNRDTREDFTLIVQDQPPVITKFFADPNPIIQRPFKTTLKATTNIDTFCKFSNNTNQFDNMEHNFPGFNLIASTTHNAEIEVPQLSAYTFFISCKSASGLGPIAAQTTFRVDSSTTFKLQDNTPPNTIFAGESAIISIGSNKDSLCSYTGDETLLFVERQLTQNHLLTQIFSPGKHIVNTTCRTGGATVIGGQPENAAIQTPFGIDTQPPRMIFVRDDALSSNPQLTADRDRLRVIYNGSDPDSGVRRYEYQIRDQNNKIIKNLTADNNPEKEVIITGLQLTNQTRYFFDVRAVDFVERNSTFLASDGILVDTSVRPATCINNKTDGTETALDCGGSCTPCEDGKKCKSNSDCTSVSCDHNICGIPSCNDNLKNGNETDIDCGRTCPTCNTNKTCISNTDCSTGFCGQRGICQEPAPCQNKALDSGESDIDCGGACPSKCIEGKQCSTSTDCATGLSCQSSGSNDIKTCVDKNKDSDGDGIPDDYERRHNLNPSVPDAGEDPDGDGLTNDEEYQYFKKTGKEIDPQKRDTDGDEAPDGLEIGVGTDPLDPKSKPTNQDSDQDGMPDDWEKRHGLDPNNNADAKEDPDGDGLTNLDEYKYLKETGKEINPNKKDTDGDGFSDKDEINAGTDPTNENDYPGAGGKDTDLDGIPDEYEQRHGLDPKDANDATADPDEDGMTNLEEYNHFKETGQDIDPHKKDTDNDGFSDYEESQAGSNAVDDTSTPQDSDGDGIPDFFEKKYGLDPQNSDDAKSDPDGDGLTNLEEYKYFHEKNRFIDPQNSDTDGDGYNDGKELRAGSDPTNVLSVPLINWPLWGTIIALLLLGGIGSYYWYTQRKQTSTLPMPRIIQQQPKPVLKITGETPIQTAQRDIKSLPLEKQPKKKETEIEYQTLDNLTKTMEEHESPIFSQLRKSQEKDQPQLTPLQEIAFSRFTTEERKDIQEKLSLLRQGKLTAKEREKLFKKLRITAAYWEKNKDKIQKQSELWLRPQTTLKRTKKT